MELRPLDDYGYPRYAVTPTENYRGYLVVRVNCYCITKPHIYTDW